MKDLFLGIKKFKPCLNLKEKKILIKEIDKLPYSNLNSPSYQKNLFSKTNKKINYDNVNSLIFKDFEKHCYDYLNHIPKKINICSWVHITWKDPLKKANVVHCHNKSNMFALSGIFYLHLPKKSETTFFFCEDKKFSLPKEELTWFIFRSDLYHQPGRCFEKEKRYCISADFWINYKI